MLEYNEIVQRKFIEMDGQPYEVLSSHVFRKQQRKPVNQTKLRNIITGKVMEHSFHQSEKAEEANLTNQKIKYLFTNKGEHWFCEETNPSARFSLSDDMVGDKIRFMKPNSLIDALSYDDNIIGVTLPVKVELLVKESAPAVKGNTVQGGSKQVVLETGATLNVPMFINEGDILRINTDTGDYVERVDKK